MTRVQHSMLSHQDSGEWAYACRRRVKFSLVDPRNTGLTIDRVFFSFSASKAFLNSQSSITHYPQFGEQRNGSKCTAGVSSTANTITASHDSFCNNCYRFIRSILSRPSAKSFQLQV